MDECITITLEDVQPEVEFWQSSVVAFGIGNMVKIWGRQGYQYSERLVLDQISYYGDRDKMLDMERPFFDSMLVVTKPWNADMYPTKDIVKSISIWIHVPVYWGIRALGEIIKPVGNLIRLDETTTKREKLSYARGSLIHAIMNGDQHTTQDAKKWDTMQ
ncbi:Arginine decarboxylase [Bienertia sinuspersici]